MKLSALSFGFCTLGALADVRIATFDGDKATTLSWQAVNDPVMGGQSNSTLVVDSTRKLGVWAGEVKIVPFLHAPGFCNLQSPGMGKTASYPDLSGSSGMVVRAREASAGGLINFNVQLMSKGAEHLFKKGVYTANISLTAEMADHFVAWSEFTCTWRGETVSWCPKLGTQLKDINSVGLGTAFPGKAGPFSMEIDSISAKATSLEDTDHIDLATFDGKAPHKWKSENDPVMGGQSSSNVTTTSSYADYQGTTRIVPKLKAPGFTIAMTDMLVLSSFPDVSSMDGLTISARNIGNFSGYKLAFCDSHINWYRCQFESFKADLVIPASANGEFQDVFIPWSKFSDKWNPATGKHTAENPPAKSSTSSITQLMIWTEAVEGDFHLQFQYIRGSKAPSADIIVV